MVNGKLKTVVFLSIFSLILAPLCFADKTAWEAAESDQYGEKALGMVGRGAVNIATCPLDTVVHTVEGTKAGPAVIGTLGGLGSGLGCTMLRVLSGAVDVVTFWIPGFNGAPVSTSYSDCMDFGKGEAAPSGYEPQPYAAPASEARAPEPINPDAMQYVKK